MERPVTTTKKKSLLKSQLRRDVKKLREKGFLMIQILGIVAGARINYPPNPPALTNQLFC